MPLGEGHGTGAASGGPEGRRFASMGRTTHYGWWKRLWRLTYLRMVVPILRARNRPHHTARGVLIGVFVALTSTVGVQIALVSLFWVLFRFFNRRWDFNYLVAVAWTGLTNVVTVAPFYFAFVVTGWLMLGRWDDLESYEQFTQELTASLEVDATWYESFWVYTINLFDQFGLPLFLGSLPWAVMGGIAGYKWTLKLISAYRARRQASAARAGGRAGAPATGG